MRSTRLLLAAAAATGALALCSPAAIAVEVASDGDSHSSSRDREEHDRGSKGDHDKPHGGVHTGGGALAMTADRDGEHGRGQSDRGEHGKSDHEDRDSYGSGNYDKPRGGVHTGGGALASGSSLAAGSVLLFGGLGTMAYKVRRRTGAGAAAL
ncbi:hypothetical protein [Streptomyces sp. NPDC006879]|uniref:hypothetical protein n=1 Tax=Streptomyces sp. NPDC006879 TaxID=3364767 RepID=UPI0036B78808